jgi:hypothetical protein
MPLHRESRFGLREPQTNRTLKRRERRAPIPTGLRPPAQGCAPRATLGHAPNYFPQPQRGCVLPFRTHRRNPVGVNKPGKTQRLARLYERKLAALAALEKSLLPQAFTGEL